ncbi:MAG: hypothetical protein M3Y75_08825 [Actinomycetota bacterium]|nr:hypothetical protein [Actinomycetota bacterium]
MARWGRAALLSAAALAVIAGGCGEEGAEEGAVLTVYVSAPGQRLCDEARAEARGARTVDDHTLRVVCLDAGSAGGGTLAKVGSNARRATEDSTAVAYVGEPDRETRKQSQPILNAAEIAQLGEFDGREAIGAVVAAIDEGDSDDPRAAVFDAIEG